MILKHLLSNARSPVLSHFGAAVAGMGRLTEFPYSMPSTNSCSLVSIRAYGAQQTFKQESLKRIDRYLRISRTSYNLNRWIGIRMDLLGASFTTSLATYLLIRKTLNAANIGFSLNMSLEFCSVILYIVRCYNDFEVEANRYTFFSLLHDPLLKRNSVWNESSPTLTLNMNRSQPQKESLLRRGQRPEN